MANGFSTERMLDLVLEGQQDIRDRIEELNKKIDLVMNHGCAHRSDDLRRIEILEEWKSKGITGFIVLCVTTIASMAALIWETLVRVHKGG